MSELSAANRALIERFRIPDPKFSNWDLHPADLERLLDAARAEGPAPVSAPLDREGVAEARTQLYALCEHMEDEAIAALAKEPDAHEHGYWRGQKLAAKSISRAMGEVFRELITAPQEPGDTVAAEIAKMEALVGPSFVEMLNDLRREEGDTVTLLCDNPDFNGQPNNAIECNGAWTGWQERRFTGETLHAAVTAAYTAKTALTGQQDQVGLTTPAVLGEPSADALRSGGDDAVGAAERDVGRYIYRRIETLMDAKHVTGIANELTYLATIAEAVEEYGPEACGGEDLSVFQVPTPPAGGVK